MKKYTLLQAILVAVVALIAGLFIGFAIRGFSPSAEGLAGTIGKVDRYRNVKITDDDILLRNELVEDTSKRAQYEKFLLYYYYQSLKTSLDVEQVLKKTTVVKDFNDTYYPYSDALTNFKTYLETARTDILAALNVIISLNENENIPIITYLNEAQNAIARIRNHDAILMNYMNAITSFIKEHPDVTYDELEDAHDILAMNILQAAVFTQNKPVLSYLDKKKLMNKKEGINELASEAQLSVYMLDQFAMDTDRLMLLFNTQQLQMTIFNDMESLQGFVLADIEQFNTVILASSDALQSASALGNMQTLQLVILDTEAMGLLFSAPELLGVLYDGSQLNAAAPR